jgi:hypothetical protein
MIEDETKSGFKLVMNGFVQNETALPKLNLQKFPEGENQVLILLENGFQIRRKIPKLEKGIHKYVIYKTFRGDFKIRYRGSSGSLSQSAIMIDYHDDLAHVDPSARTIVQADTLSRFEEWQEAQADPIAASAPLPKADSVPVSHKVVLETEIVVPAQVEERTATVDSLKGKENPQDKLVSDEELESQVTLAADAPEKPNEAQAYESFEQQFKLSQFEFDKLKLAKDFVSKYPMSAEQSVRVLKGLKYDQSRLDFLQYLLSKQDNLGEAKAELLSCFDYELSIQQAKKLFK